MFNAACTPAFNIIETVFCDLKFFIRRKNKINSKGLVEEARNFLSTKVNRDFIMKKKAQACKYFIQALLKEEF